MKNLRSYKAVIHTKPLPNEAIDQSGDSHKTSTIETIYGGSDLSKTSATCGQTSVVMRGSAHQRVEEERQPK